MRGRACGSLRRVARLPECPGLQWRPDSFSLPFMSADRILIVRTSSMGDLVHTLPVVSDIQRHRPGAIIDWVSEEAFAEIPTWHPGVNGVVPMALRRWRKAWFSPPVRAERALFKQRLQTHQYSAVIDLQGLIKSAVLVALRARGPSHGLDRHSAREGAAALFYRHRHAVAPMQPAVLRYRTLAGLALGYEWQGDPDFGLDALADPVAGRAVMARVFPDLADTPYVAIMPSASRPPKLWPEVDWIAVMEQGMARGYVPLVFAGNADEQQRAARLASAVAGARVVPRLPLSDAARVVAGAHAMIGLDSGLTHLAAALGRPSVAIYCSTPVVRTPLTGAAYCASLGDRGQPPTRDAVLAAVETALGAPAASAARA